jgi:steroid delta-isomerase-like uncharacterized protein
MRRATPRRRERKDRLRYGSLFDAFDARGDRAPSGASCGVHMTASETKPLIERYYAAFNRGDWNAMLDALDEAVVHDLNQGGRETGRDAFRAFLARMDRCYAEQLREVVVFADESGTRAAAEYVVHGRYKISDEGLPPATGQTYVLPGGAFFEIRSGRIARVSNYYNLQDWLRQVGA